MAVAGSAAGLGGGGQKGGPVVATDSQASLVIPVHRGIAAAAVCSMTFDPCSTSVLCPAGKQPILHTLERASVGPVPPSLVSALNLAALMYIAHWRCIFTACSFSLCMGELWLVCETSSCPLTPPPRPPPTQLLAQSRDLRGFLSELTSTVVGGATQGVWFTASG